MDVRIYKKAMCKESIFCRLAYLLSYKVRSTKNVAIVNVIPQTLKVCKVNK